MTNYAMRSEEKKKAPPIENGTGFAYVPFFSILL